MVLTAPKALAALTAVTMVLAGTLLLTTDQVRDRPSSGISVASSDELQRSIEFKFGSGGNVQRGVRRFRSQRHP